MLHLAGSNAQSSGSCVGSCQSCTQPYCKPALTNTLWKATSYYHQTYDNQVLYPRAHVQVTSTVQWNWQTGQSWSDVPVRGPYSFCSFCTSSLCSDDAGSIDPPCNPTLIQNLLNQSVSPLVWYYAVYYGRCGFVSGGGVRGIVLSRYEYGTAFFNSLKTLLDNKASAGLIGKDVLTRDFSSYVGRTFIRRFHVYGGGSYRQTLLTALSSTNAPYWFSIQQLTGVALPNAEEDLLIILGDILSPSDFATSNNECDLCVIFGARLPDYNPYESLSLFGVNPAYNPLQYAPKLTGWRDFWLSLFSIIPTYQPCSMVRNSALVDGMDITERSFGESYGYTLDQVLLNSGYLMREGYFQYGEVLPVMSFDLPGYSADGKSLGLIYTLYLDTCSSGLAYIGVMGRLITWALFTVWFAFTLRNTVAKIADSTE
jgi:hypothetical protein